MTETLDPLVLNFLYATSGGVLTLFFMWLGCYLFNRLVCTFQIGEELASCRVIDFSCVYIK